MSADDPDDFQPTEESIAKMLARFTPRQLAIGYLRAQRRFRQTDLAFRTLVDIDDANVALRNGEDLDTVTAPLKKAARRFNREF